MKAIHYEERREALGACIENESTVILFSGVAPQRSADYPYSFTPYRHFLYLTGIDRENSVFVMSKIDGKMQSILFIEKSDEVMEKWTGIRMKPDEAKAISGISAVMHTESLENYLQSLFLNQNIKRIYMSIEHMNVEDIGNYNYHRGLQIQNRFPYVELRNISPMIGKMRTVKSQEEIEEIRKAVSVTEKGLYRMLDVISPGMKEYELEAEFDYTVRKEGCTGFSFKTIVASGGNATVLHYETNREQMEDGQLVLIDLGAEHNYYCGDLTRTFPINGKFSERQKQIYEIVLEAQEKVIQTIAPGIPLRSLNDIVKAVYGERLKEIGLIQSDEDVGKYYYHGVSHHLGLDTHDVCEYGVTLKPGMVITVEPGIYIAEEQIGIRIEDDILVTENGAEVLSKNMIKTVTEIEQYMNKK